ncbi:uncharacterized protein [Typha latifolia]|uniref:uncharacterized protein isoform X2 n=1 Tax=Typha latifolia TaxID=4733 RepID=UPI003C2F1141
MAAVVDLDGSTSEARVEASVENLDHIPLLGRRRLLLSGCLSSSLSATKKCPVDVADKRVQGGTFQKWPGLPRGVKFDPSDGDLLWHLLAKVGNEKALPHPFIGEFINCLDEENRFGYIHPQKLPGIKQDGSASYFFHKAFKRYNVDNGKLQKIGNDYGSDISWRKIGKTKPVAMDGSKQGCKKVFVLYTNRTKDKKPEKTNWIMHQYHLGTVGEEGEGEFVVSKVFYQLRSREGGKHPCDLKSVEAHAQVVEYHDARCETNSGHSEFGNIELDDYHCIKHLKKGDNETQVLVDAQLPGGLLARCKLLEKHSSSTFDQVESRYCLSDNSDASACLTDNPYELSMGQHDSRGACQLEIGQANMVTEGNLSQDIQEYEGVKVENPNYGGTCSCRDGLDSTLHAPAGGLTSEPVIDELDDVMLQERYNMLVGAHSCSSYIAAPGCGQDGRLPALKEMSNRSWHAEANGLISKSKTDRMENNRTIYRQDILSIWQDISSGPSIMENINECESGKVLDEDSLPGRELPSGERFVDSVTESDATNSVNNLVLHSPLSLFSGSHFAVDRWKPISSNCQNDNLLKHGHSGENHESNMFSYQTSFPEEEHLTCNSDLPRHSVRSEADHAGEGYLNNISETNDASQPTVDESGSSVTGLLGKGTPCLSEVRSCHTSRTSETQDRENYHEVLISHRVEVDKDKGQVPYTVLTTLPAAIKAEPPSESDNDDRIHLFSSQNVCSKKSCSLDPEASSGNSHFEVNHLSNASNLLESVPAESELSEDVLHNLGVSKVLNVNASSTMNSLSSENCCRFPMVSLPDVAYTDTKDKLSMEKVKTEPMESDLPGLHEHVQLKISESVLSGDEVKSEALDLVNNIELPVSGSSLDSHTVKTLNHRTLPQTQLCDFVGTVHVNAGEFSRRRKRKRTATDSVETALEEDAPGLLKVLLDRGITADEIKLYDDKEDDESLEVSSTESNFEELETVITKLFSERSSLFRFPTARHIKGSKAVYCLACLIALIEQIRYLRFRNSPVEWGWCRDLQSFIFIFESHNRIVLERPEYGYATYFFEIVESLPIDWQIKRLVTAMKLSSCSRTTLIENKPLLVGEDLSVGEARILEEYGWIPNSGLGTLLNYCDRVVHDKRNEMYSSEWKAKIGRLLMDGQDSGRTVVNNLPNKVLKYMVDQNLELKLERV